MSHDINHLPTRDDVYIVGIYEDWRNRSAGFDRDIIKIYTLAKHELTKKFVEHLTPTSSSYTTDTRINREFLNDWTNYQSSENGKMVFHYSHQKWMNHKTYHPDTWVQYRAKAYDHGAPTGQPENQPHYIGRQCNFESGDAPDEKGFLEYLSLKYNAKDSEKSTECWTNPEGTQLYEFSIHDHNHPVLDLSYLSLWDKRATEKIPNGSGGMKNHQYNKAEFDALYNKLEMDGLLEDGALLKHLGFGIPQAKMVFTNNMYDIAHYDAFVGIKLQQKENHFRA